jgi:hypothetical protein
MGQAGRGDEKDIPLNWALLAKHQEYREKEGAHRGHEIF